LAATPADADMFHISDTSDTNDPDKRLAASRVAFKASGTWTPAITGSTSNPTITYTTQVGKYTQLGNVVFFSMFVEVATVSGGSGWLRISLPWYSANTSNADYTQNSIRIASVNMTYTGTVVGLTFTISAGNAYGQIDMSINNAATDTMTVTEIAAGDQYAVSGFYFVS
jgi:hypothetical protein